jgi:hypothetical protein
VLDNEQSPFTFFNILFISRNDFEGGRIAEMMEHERAHKDQLHSFDALLLEMVTIFQWFNPVIWLFKQALKSEHEYYADKAVLNKGFDRVRYQKLLFEKSLGTLTIELTNSFNYLLLKKRLKMMTIQKTNSLMKIKYLISMPIMFVIVAFILINCQKKDQDIAQYKPDQDYCNNELFIIVEQMPEYKDGGTEGLRKFIAENLVYPESAIKNQVCGKVYVQYMVDDKGKARNAVCLKSTAAYKHFTSDSMDIVDGKIIADMQTAALNVISALGDFTPGLQRGKAVAVNFTIPIVFDLN